MGFIEAAVTLVVIGIIIFIAIILLEYFQVLNVGLVDFLGQYIPSTNTEAPDLPETPTESPVEQTDVTTQDPTFDPNPQTTDQVNPEYMGCYRDKGWEGNPRVFPTFAGILNAAACNEKAKAIGSKYFGLQFFEDGSGTPGLGVNFDTAQCWIGGNNPYDRDGAVEEAACPPNPIDGKPRGVGWTNAVFKTV